MNLPRFLKVLIFTSAFFFCSADGVYAQLSITPNTWNVIGLDSNKATTDGPNEFPVGAKVCNTSSSALSNLNTTFYWDSTNSLIILDTGGTTQSITQSSLAANTCVDVYFTVVITRDTAAYNTTRRYHITSSATGASTVSTPTPREIYVEKLVSQNRNAVISISGPTTVYVGQIYNYTVNGSTATNGYEQLEAFLNLSNVIFRVLSVNTTYSVPVGATNDKLYADSCGWDNNPLSGTYRSCSSTGKAGGTLTTVYTVLILSAGTTTASTLIYDFSGSSYHYNSDFGTAISSITITALPGGSISGTVFDDVNGLTDSIVNGTGTNAGGLFANLLDGNNNVVSSVAVAANGTYSFPTVVSGAYNIQISTIQGVESSAAPAATLPNGWVNTGEHLGAGTGSDGTVNSRLPVTVAAVAINNANFGIEQRPTANNNTAASQTNPGGTNNATVPATVFSGGDTAPGTVSNIRITAFPSNATSITINGTQYTSANFPAGGVTVPTNASGNPTQPILVDPTGGAVTVGIPYLTIDNAGVESSTTATASVPFGTVSISGTVFNDVNGLTDSTVNGIGIGGSLYANLLDGGGNVVQTMLVPASGAYSFAGLSSGNYNVQVSINQGNVGSPAPTTALSAGWANTGENLGAGAGNDGAPNGNLPVAIGTTPTNVTNANFGIEQRPVAADNTAASQANFGGTINATVPPTTFSATDTTPGTVSGIRISAFPGNATTITINGTQYTAAAFPSGGVSVPTNTSGNPTQTILVDPFDGAVTVGIPYMAIDNAGMESAATATASVPFTVAPTAANGNISGTIYSGGNPIRDMLVVLIDATSNSRAYARTDANGNYLFSDKEVGKTYIIQPLSSKYSFSPAASVVNLLGNANGLNFESSAKTYRPKNDFDGDGKSDIAVFRPSDGNWYVLRSSDEQMSVFKFGLSTDIPVSGDFDGDGKTDYAVFRPSEGNWYIRQSKTQDIRVENFGLADDKLIPSDFDGDGKADIAVYRNGIWYIHRSSDDSFETRNFGLETDTPVTGDFDGDGKTDFSVYRPSDGIWYTLHSLSGNFSTRTFGLAADVPVPGDFDGDGFSDIAQFRNGDWYILGSTTAFEASQFGLGEDKSIVGDYDGDGRADQAVYRGGVWYIRNSGDGTVRNVYFGLPTDILVK